MLQSNAYIVRSQQIRSFAAYGYTVMEAAEKISNQVVSSLAGYSGDLFITTKLKDINQPPPAYQQISQCHILVLSLPVAPYKAPVL
jgi:hypothetical protein